MNRETFLKMIENRTSEKATDNPDATYIQIIDNDR
jgi:hypothetical protein